jgi:hypothetical protein
MLDVVLQLIGGKGESYHVGSNEACQAEITLY